MKQIFPTPIRLILLSVLFAISCTSPRETVQQQSGNEYELHQEISELIVRMPVSDPDEYAWVLEQLTETGAEGIRILSQMLMPDGAGDDSKARYAISSWATYVTNPGMDSRRTVFESAILDELDGSHSAQAKKFLIEQLTLTGTDRSVPKLALLLRDEKLYLSVIRVLVTLNTERSAEALREALQGARGDRRIAIIQALGKLKDPEAVDTLTGLLSDDNMTTRRMALYALAEIGDPSANEAISRIVHTTEPARQSEVAKAHLRYAETLAHRGYQQSSAEISRHYLSESYADNLRRMALSSLFRAEGIGILDELIDLSLTSGATLRGLALSKINSLEGSAVTDRLVLSLQNTTDTQRAHIITVLGERGDSSALTSLKTYANDESGLVRAATAEALYRLAGNQSLPILMHILQQAESEQEAETIEVVLYQVPADDLVQAASRALPEASNYGKQAQLRILAAHNATNHLEQVWQVANHEYKPVRLEMYRTLQVLAGLNDVPELVLFLNGEPDDEEVLAILQAITGIINRSGGQNEMDEMIRQLFLETSDDQKTLLLAITPVLDSTVALEAAREALNDSNESVRHAAVVALLEWNNAEVLPALLEVLNIIPESKKDNLYAVYIHQVNLMDKSLDERAASLHELVDHTESMQDKAGVIRHFFSANDLLALKAAAKYFTHDEPLRGSAVEVAGRVLVKTSMPDEGLLTSASAVLAVVDESVRSELETKLEELSLGDDVFIASKNINEMESDEPRAVNGKLFNDRDLDGWEAVGSNPGSWNVANGILYTDGEGSGWLSTTATYDNFILELEFRVPEGGNSGVFIRAPREGNPAYQGMEIQILDDYAERYARLRPWQYTGSIYDIKAPSKRATKPAGEWQSMVIRADGPDVRVTLNGEMVLNANLIHHMESVERHPGLVRRSGYIGLQNHSSRVEFRNILLQEIQ